MVKLCYIVSLVCLDFYACSALSLYPKMHSKQTVLSKSTNDLASYNFAFIEPLSKRNLSYKKAKKIKGDTNSEENYSTDEEPSDNWEENSNPNQDIVTNYGLRKLQKKLRLGDKKYEVPVTQPVPEWDDQYYYDDGRPIIYQVDTEELKEILDDYIDMGKEKWAAFLATSDCNKFQKFFKKLQNLLHQNEGEDDYQNKDALRHGSTKEKNKGNNNDYEDDEEKEDYEEGFKDSMIWGKGKTTYTNNPNINQFKLKKQKGLRKSEEQKLKDKQNSMPQFSILPWEELEEFQKMFQDVITYWENDDAKDILELSKGLSYKDFEIDENIEVNEAKKNFKSDKSLDENDSKTSYDNNFDKENEEPDDDDYELLTMDLLDKLDPKYFKTKNQMEWLKANAVRRAHILQKLLDGDYEDDEQIFSQDWISYRENNIFLDQDDNEFASNGFRLQSTNMAIYVFFFVEAALFYIF